MVKPMLHARGPLVVGVLALFLACAGLSLFCPMPAEGHGGWEPAAVVLLRGEAVPRRSADIRSSGRVETARAETAGPLHYLLLTTFRL